MRLCRTFSIFIILFFEVLTVIGQEDQLRFEHLTRASGLSQSTVYTITQDKLGFIWFGTSDGLNRYDGYTIKKYFFDLKNPNSLSNNRIYNLMVDHNGNLWIATLGGGLNKYRVETDDFISYRYNKNDPNSISQDIVMSLLEDKNGSIWVGTADGGLNQFDKDRKTFKRFYHDPNDPSSIAFNTIISIAADKQGNLWLGSNQGGVDKYDPRNNIFTHFSYSSNDPNTISSNNVNHIFIDSRNLVYISTDNGLTILDPETSKIKRIYSSHLNNQALRTSDVHCVLEDKDHNIWVGTYGGLSLLKNKDYNLFEFKNYFNNPVDIFSLSNNLIRCIYQDRSGLIWVGNFSNGVDKFNPTPSKFISYQNNPKDNASLSNNIVRCFNEDKEGNIWIGTFGGGLNRFDLKSRQFKVFRNDKLDKNTLSLNFINSICIDSENNLWIGTYGGGLNFYNQKTGKFKRFCWEPNSSECLSNNYIRSMLLDKEGLLWIATSGGGLNQFNPKAQEFTHFMPDNYNPYSISDARIMGLCEDFEGNIWVGSSSEGLNKLIRSENKFVHFKNDPQNPKSISSDRIFCIHEAADHKSLWVGTGNGLNRFNKENSTFDHFTKDNGFPSDVILGILEDKTGFLWISTNDGLCKFDPRPDQCKILKVYDDRDGLNSSEFSEGAFFRNKQDNLFFGGVKGFTFFDPHSIIDNPLKPVTYVVDFKLFNKDVPIDSNSILKKNIIVTKEINLKYSDYVFSFEFSALNYNHPEKNQYLYKLEGFDENWVSTNANRRFVTYTNLDPEKYTFMVKASNNDGVWSDVSTNINLIVYPPFWKTWWFRVLVVFIIILCLVGYYRWRVAALRKQKLVLEQIVNEKTARVIVQQEELQAINEELTANNEELFNQRKELEATLISLQSAQKQLIQSEKMALLGTLSAGIAHEINNPLNFIQGGILGIKNYLNDDLPESIEKYNPLIDAINVGIERASVIVASLNNYSRHGELPNTDCDIHSIIESCLVIMQNKIKNRIEVYKEFTEKKYVVFGSEGKLHQAFLNLLANAEQSIEDRGTINIVTQVEENYVVITITDSGCGISLENLPKIFDPFYTTKAPGKGTGLGLSITLNIIHEHNGTIDYESQLCKGTKVIIKLPTKI